MYEGTATWRLPGQISLELECQGRDFGENVDSSGRVFSVTLPLMTMTMVIMMLFCCYLDSTGPERKNKDLDSTKKAGKQSEGTSSSLLGALILVSWRVNPMASVKGRKREGKKRRKEGRKEEGRVIHNLNSPPTPPSGHMQAHVSWCTYYFFVTYMFVLVKQT